MSDFWHAGRARWFIIAFLVFGIIMTVMLGWQLFETTPARWCVMAKQGSPELASGCVTILMKLLEIKDHVVIGLLGITGLSVLGLAAVALGLRFVVSGPGGLNANIGADRGTTTTVTVETPPSDPIS